MPPSAEETAAPAEEAQTSAPEEMQTAPAEEVQTAAPAEQSTEQVISPNPPGDAPGLGLKRAFTCAAFGEQACGVRIHKTQSSHGAIEFETDDATNQATVVIRKTGGDEPTRIPLSSVYRVELDQVHRTPPPHHRSTPSTIAPPPCTTPHHTIAWVCEGLSGWRGAEWVGVWQLRPTELRLDTEEMTVVLTASNPEIARGWRDAIGEYHNVLLWQHWATKGSKQVQLPTKCTLNLTIELAVRHTLTLPHYASLCVTLTVSCVADWTGWQNNLAAEDLGNTSDPFVVVHVNYTAPPLTYTQLVVRC